MKSLSQRNALKIEDLILTVFAYPFNSGDDDQGIFGLGIKYL